ncbi:MAG TPA: gephyrin-like molybdotransferase Glp [Pirellulales bacterium]|nr:gephyrin-like molybdotransferase Glp [Pirellulales bacterium]
MLSVDEALARIEEVARPKTATRMPMAECLGLVLAEDVASDVDSPPHDKSIVDGYAVTAADLAGGEACLTVLEEVVAGKLPTRRVERGTATRIMTGAPLPEGAEAVVMVEQTELETDAGGPLGQVQIRTTKFSAGQNIMRRAASLRQGDVVLRAGRVLRPIEIGLLAEVGRTEVLAIPRPAVAVLPTGDELVEPRERPGPGQIRNSNGPMLAASIRRAGGVPIELGIGRDERGTLSEQIAAGLQADVLLLSGGVSAGVLDLVPELLVELGVRKVFHKVSLKPGKPLWFGVLDRGQTQTLVFGLPGNPVSSLVCFELFVRPTLARLAGRPFAGLSAVRARLTTEFLPRGERSTYHPALLAYSAAGAAIEPLAWKGSADLRGLSAANALVYFPAGDRTFHAGDWVDAFPLE